MSRFFSAKYSDLEPYVPGEQPKDTQYIKLNTNESPFPPSDAVVKAASLDAEKLNLYCDPECTALRNAAAELYGVSPDNVMAVNGSDEILYYAFMAFGDETHPYAFPEISYGFYPVYAKVNHVPAFPIPLRPDFTIDYRDYCGIGKNIVIANPNAPTGITLPPEQIEEIIASNPDNIVVIDEAYVDFGGVSCVPLIRKYDNLIVTQTFSKSRSLAGARLGFGIACEALIRDLNSIRYSVNPYNVNRMTQAAGIAACRDAETFRDHCARIQENRAYTVRELKALDFTVLDSKANFIFASPAWTDGETLYRRLKERGILVRHFSNEKISSFCRISIGTLEQMQALVAAVRKLKQEAEA